MGVGFKIGLGGTYPPAFIVTKLKPRFGGAFFAPTYP
jgi:hypothetical protein